VEVGGEVGEVKQVRVNPAWNMFALFLVAASGDFEPFLEDAKFRLIPFGFRPVADVFHIDLLCAGYEQCLFQRLAVFFIAACRCAGDGRDSRANYREGLPGRAE
jgi:hypothetical protein